MKNTSVPEWQSRIAELLARLKGIVGNKVSLYLSGGAVRDILLGNDPVDLDLVVSEGAMELAQKAAEHFGCTLVPLDEENGISRVVLTRDKYLDFSDFRQGASDIFKDLSLRDFTINAMAVQIENVPYFLSNLNDKDRRQDVLIDPHRGLEDLESRIIRPVKDTSFMDDPLRILRGYRFMAQLGFKMTETARVLSARFSNLLSEVSAERISYELLLIMKTRRASEAFKAMAEDQVLGQVLPELSKAKGVDQPGFHHLDVFGHCLETLATIEILIEDPCTDFLPCEPMVKWLEENRELIPWLKWAALLHDVGKPVCRGEREDGRPTFYNHDREGAQIVAHIGKRLRWPKKKIEFVARLVRLHMRPFFLLSEIGKGGPTPRAMRRLFVEIEGDYPALFLLSMADSKAGCGPLKPEDLDTKLSLLWEQFNRFYVERMRPVKKRPRLLTGHDLQELFGLKPGPVIGKCLDALEEAQVEGIITSRQDAIRWAKNWIQGLGDQAGS